jgi:mevalonate kinase
MAHSKKRRIEEKAMKLQLKLAVLVKDTETKKFKVDHVVISFSRMEELKEFEEKFDEAINKLKEGTKKE